MENKGDMIFKGLVLINMIVLMVLGLIAIRELARMNNNQSDFISWVESNAHVDP